MHTWIVWPHSLDIGYERSKAISDILQPVQQLCEVRNPASIAFLCLQILVRLNKVSHFVPTIELGSGCRGRSVIALSDEEIGGHGTLA
jgi:hypothetical protein